jgi:hypothetical protein
MNIDNKIIQKPIDLIKGGPGSTFQISELINHFKKEKINYITIGATHIRLDKHPKPKSLDVWLRNHKNVVSSYKNTCQSIGIVIDEIVKSGKFSIGKRKCPKSNKICKALIFDNSDAK